MNTTCQWLLPPTEEDTRIRSTCDKPAVAEVTVKTKITQAKVSLCAEHKRQHNVQFAQARTSKS